MSSRVEEMLPPRCAAAAPRAGLCILPIGMTLPCASSSSGPSSPTSVPFLPSGPPKARLAIGLPSLPTVTVLTFERLSSAQLVILSPSFWYHERESLGSTNSLPPSCFFWVSSSPFHQFVTAFLMSSTKRISVTYLKPSTRPFLIDTIPSMNDLRPSSILVVMPSRTVPLTKSPASQSLPDSILPKTPTAFRATFFTLPRMPMPPSLTTWPSARTFSSVPTSVSHMRPRMLAFSWRTTLPVFSSISTSLPKKYE